MQMCQICSVGGHYHYIYYDLDRIIKGDGFPPRFQYDG